MAEVDGPETFAEFKKTQAEAAASSEGKGGSGRDQSMGSESVKGAVSANIVSGAISEGSKELKSRDRKRITTEINQSK
jgi:hypothetical protein